MKSGLNGFGLNLAIPTENIMVSLILSTRTHILEHPQTCTRLVGICLIISGYVLGNVLNVFRCKISHVQRVEEVALH